MKYGSKLNTNILRIIHRDIDERKMTSLVSTQLSFKRMNKKAIRKEVILNTLCYER